MAGKIEKILKFFLFDIWRMELDELSAWRKILIRYTRMFTTAIRGFINDHCSLRASALTFYSVLSIVPVAAVAFAIAKGFGFEEDLKAQLLERFSENQDALARVFEFSDKMLQNTQGGVIAGVGIFFLLYAVIKLFSNIEKSFNYIWGEKRHRTFFRKITDYLLLVILGPVMVLVAGSATVYISSHLDSVMGTGMNYIPAGGEIFLNAVKMVIIKLIPYCLSWMLFTFIYIFIPNVKVKFRSALFGGIIAGSAYQFLQVWFIFMQVSLSKNNAIYGSFAALPLFLIWLQLSWLIVLLGAELSFSYQCTETYRFEPHALRINNSLRKVLSLYIVQMVIKSFIAEEPPLAVETITLKSGIPIRLVRDIVDHLTQVNILSPTLDEHEQLVGYKPSVPIDKLTVQFVLDRLDNFGLDDLPSLKSEVIADVQQNFNEMVIASRNAPQNMLLKDI
jgi:membrane protein